MALKNVRLTESKSLEFLFEGFNIFNPRRRALFSWGRNSFSGWDSNGDSHTRK